MVDTNMESLAIKKEIKENIIAGMKNDLSESDLRFLADTFDKVSSRYRFSRKANRYKTANKIKTEYILTL